MEIIASGGPLGAEVRGIDMREPLSAAEVATIRQAWNDHLVLAVRGQVDVSLDDHMAFSRHFGELAMSPPSPVTGKRGEFEGVPPEAFFAQSFDGTIPRGTVTFHDAFNAKGTSAG